MNATKTTTATQELRAEHVAVIRMLDIMEAMSPVSGRRGLPDTRDLESAIEFLRVFVDRCHHAKEEVLLFPAMAAAGQLEVQKAIDSLLAQHHQGREILARLQAVADRIAEGDTFAKDDLAEQISAYDRLLRRHIQFEEPACFDPADRELPADVQSDLAEGYEKIEEEVIGHGRHEQFEVLLDELEMRYLTPPT